MAASQRDIHRARAEALFRPPAGGAGHRASFGPGMGMGGYLNQAYPYEAGRLNNAEMGDWWPAISSPDREINPNRDRMVARQRDVVRNDGFATGLISRILDSTIGDYYRVVSKPDYRALAARFAKGFDALWATEFRSVAEARWRSYSEDPGHYNDVSRRQTVTQQFRLMLGHKLIDGESLGVRYWLEDRIGRGAARYATALCVVDPDRLSNPRLQPDTKFMRGGIETNELGVPLAAHIRRAHQNDWYNAVESMEWDRVAFEDDDGFQRVIHDFDLGRAGQNRGVSIFAPVLGRMKMLARYYGVKLQQETVAAHFGTYITSPYDRQMVEQALGDEDELAELEGYGYLREAFHERNAIGAGDFNLKLLAPGEEVNGISSARPPGEMTPFAHEMLRSVGSAAGVSGEQVTQDYSEVNFSSMRVGITNSEKTYKRRVADFNSNTATPVFGGWLHEAMELGEFDDVLPRNAPDFLEARAEFTRCHWLGAARGWYDPVAERQGKALGLDGAYDTLENVGAEQGMDWEETLDQRAIELQRCRDLNIPPPTFFGDSLTATQASAKPEAR